MVHDALTDLQVKELLASIEEKQLYLFVMLGLYAGLRQGEILALQWDCVFFDCAHPYLSVRRSWRTERGLPVVTTQLKTAADKRDVPIPEPLIDCLREARQVSTSRYVIANSDGGPLSLHQFKLFWKPIEVCSSVKKKKRRSTGVNGIERTMIMESGNESNQQRAEYAGLDFHVTPHQLRHTYVLNKSIV